ncbi:MAG: hypothetical protein JXR23_01440 [Pontiellaceae bacterium]|nr:hypothetical protein [Pontiellaceae bacterium]
MKKKIIHKLIALALFLLGIAWLPAAWNGRWAQDWFEGDPKLQSRLAEGVAEWLEEDLSRNNFTTGSKQFDGEWLFGTYCMAAMGFGQCAVAHPDERGWERERYLELMEQAIDEMLSDRVRQYDRESWPSDPLDSLDSDDAHAAYLGYMNLAMSFHCLLVPDSKFSELNDRITQALRRRVSNSPTLLIETYPSETYPVDNCAVIASIALNNRVHRIANDELIEEWIRCCRKYYIDPKSGLLYQAMDDEIAYPRDAPRGSGTTLGLYMLSFMDLPLARDLYAAVHDELAQNIFGFGFMREYPKGIPGKANIDSGPVIFGLGLSPTGFALSGARICGDRSTFKNLYATAHAAGAPLKDKETLHYVTGASLGDAILFAMLTAVPNGIEGILP